MLHAGSGPIKGRSDLNIASGTYVQPVSKGIDCNPKTSF
jgi:hypothetical protein